jgi:hypothetical protein
VGGSPPPPADLLSPDARQFLETFVSGMRDLDVLAALLDGERRWWDARSMAAFLSAPPAETRRVLDRFAAANLLDIRVSEDVRYRLHPGSEDVANQLQAFAAVYRQTPAVVFRWVAGRAGRSVSDFADAFRLHRGRND